MSQRTDKIIDLLGGIDYSEAEAVVKHLDSEIWIWQQMLDAATTPDRRTTHEGIVNNLQRRRRLWAELAAVENEEMEQRPGAAN